MRLDFDLNVGALYIALSDLPVVRTIELGDNANVDLDADGTVVGIEVIAPDHPWPLNAITSKFRIPPGQLEQIRAYFPLAAPQPSPAFSVASPAPAKVLTAA